VNRYGVQRNNRENRNDASNSEKTDTSETTPAILVKRERQKGVTTVENAQRQELLQEAREMEME